jgi:predicted nuclease of predicted toxin-antitoxin system
MMTKDRDFIRLLEDQAPPPQGISLHLGNGGNAAFAAVLSTIPPRA